MKRLSSMIPCASLVFLLALTLAGCGSLATRIDGDPLPEGPVGFLGIRDYLSDSRHPGILHVVQVHGMGRHVAAEDCGDRSLNLDLQRKVARTLGLKPVSAYGGAMPENILVDGTIAGNYSVSLYSGVLSGRPVQLYFTCLTWGETGELVKKRVLELEPDFNERRESERGRVPLNRWGKRFVNVSLSDPVLYVGPFGAYIRSVVWTGLQAADTSHRLANAAGLLSVSTAYDIANTGMSSIPTVIISDSLGSRLVFDMLCEREVDCARLHAMSPAIKLAGSSDLKQVVAIYMFANQLPLLELAYLLPPKVGTPLETSLDERTCGLPSAAVRGSGTDKIQIVAFTDSNDLLSYRLSPDFRIRCGQSYRMSNVAMHNAVRWFWLFENPVKAHASGFKANPQALRLLVEGYRDMRSK